MSSPQRGGSNSGEKEGQQRRNEMFRSTVIACVAFAGIFIAATPAGAAVLNDTSLTDGVMTLGEGAFNGSGADSNVFDWNDMNGDTVTGDPVSGGLAMGANSLTGKTGSAGDGFQLLNVNGAISRTTGGGLYANKNNHVDAGSLTITGATDIDLLEALFSSNTGDGGAVTITHNGDLTVANNVDVSGSYIGAQSFTGGRIIHRPLPRDGKSDWQRQNDRARYPGHPGLQPGHD
jgi:hypothetical protein